MCVRGFMWKQKEKRATRKCYTNRMKEVYKLDKNTLGIIEKYDSLTSAANSATVGPGAIYYACSNIKFTCRGFKWIKVKDYGNLSIVN